MVSAVALHASFLRAKVKTKGEAIEGQDKVVNKNVLCTTVD